MATREANWDTPLDTGGEAFELLGNPRKAWIYTYIRHHPETTIQDIVETLDLPQRTVYEYVDDLETAGFVEQSNDGRPAEYTAHDIDLHLVTGDSERQITPELIEAIARRTRDEDIDTYIDRHGLDGLAIALEYAREYVDGSVTHQIMARERNLSPMEAGVILDALRPVVED
ncbi:Sugar-specific transcriptional regulator TrmB [Halobiforma haloterrestris]|uniref:Sugar-specific transcriptional regulator TrmB n=1 Tax=Natronobacterium haloterrestre TaxID=148448 RepID=A0A1I1KGS4_NATHA|nr:winged helix-turn-helix domain-containing protein [Halobiforma haloterrestris]SFC59472.1 Sugar-specific transcriptional regulator TrmB [Halobiforma haloterrestris]